MKKTTPASSDEDRDSPIMGYDDDMMKIAINMSLREQDTVDPNFTRDTFKNYSSATDIEPNESEDDISLTKSSSQTYEKELSNLGTSKPPVAVRTPPTRSLFSNSSVGPARVAIPDRNTVNTLGAG